MTPAASPPSAQRVWTSNICTPECLHLRRLSPIDRCMHAHPMPPPGPHAAPGVYAQDVRSHVFPPPDAPARRHALFGITHTRTAHLLSLALVLCSICVSLAKLLLSLFACERGIRHAHGVRVANAALRWATMGLVSGMLVELAARTLLVGLWRYMREPLHVLDASVLITVLVITVAVTDRQADEAVALLVAIRLIRLAKLLGGMTRGGRPEASRTRAGGRVERAEKCRRVIAQSISPVVHPLPTALPAAAPGWAPARRPPAPAALPRCLARLQSRGPGPFGRSSPHSAAHMCPQS